MSTRIPTGATEPIYCYAVTAQGKPLPGLLDLYMRVHRASDGEFLDWVDWTFKTSGHATLDKPLAQVDAVRTPGLYRLPGDFPTGMLANAHPEDSYTFTPLQTPGTNARLPGPSELAVGGWANVAQEVWDAPIADHLTLGSTGAALNALSVTMTGSKQITLQLRGPLAVPLQGVQIDVYDATNAFFLSRVITPISGNVNVALDPGTYALRLFKSGWAFTVPAMLTVTVDAAVTYVGTSLIVITPPSSPNLCVVYGTVRDAGGNAVANVEVKAYSVTPQTVNGVQEGAAIACTVTDANGFFQLELERKAEVSFTIETTGLDVIRTVPDLPSQDLVTWT